MIEIWKDIKGYEGLYQVSNLGRVKSLNYNHTKKEGILKPQLTCYGYLRINLKAKRNKIYSVHRLVANAFIPKPKGKTQINHINEIKTDNNVSNLEWVTCKENINHGTGIERRSKKRLISVIAIDLVTREKTNFESIKEASEKTKTSKAHICNCCKSKRNNAGGFKWRYADAVEIQG